MLHQAWVFLVGFIDLFLHLDVYLQSAIQTYGSFTHVLLILIVFCETGLVITPFLPGDSLLFAAGAFAATGVLDFPTLAVELTLAAFIGDAVNYSVGKYLGPKLLSGRILRKDYLDRTHRFYERYGAKTIIMARFVPIVRTFAPFLAGVGTMKYPRFAIYNFVGATIWVMACLFAGKLFGNLAVVRENFSLVVLAIVVISVLPAVFEMCRERKRVAQN